MALGIFKLIPPHELHELEFIPPPPSHLFVHSALQGDRYNPRGAQCGSMSGT